MKTSNAASPRSSSLTTAPVESPKRRTNKPSEKPQEISLEEWHAKGVARLNDQTTPFPRVW
jgi:hypothetical protein